MQKWTDENCGYPNICPKPAADSDGKIDYPIFFATMQEPSKDNSGEKIYMTDDYVQWRHYRYFTERTYTRKADYKLVTQKEYDSAKKKSDYWVKYKNGYSLTEHTNSDGETRFIKDLFIDEYGDLDSHKRWICKNVSFVLKNKKANSGVKPEISLPDYLLLDATLQKLYKEQPILGDNTNPLISKKEYDIIVTIIGASYEIIARCVLIGSGILPATINQNIAMIRPDRHKIVPEYLVSYMNSKYGRTYLEYLARQMEQVNLNCQEIAQFIVPIVSAEFQEMLQQIVQKAYCLLSDSRAQFKQAGSELISGLGLDIWKPSGEQISVRSFKHISFTERIDAEYYQPKYDDLISKIKAMGKGSVKTKCNVRDNNFNPEKHVEYKYIELANIGNYGEINGCTYDRGSELPTRARRQVHTGDIIIPSVEGSLQSCALIPESYDGALCSTGFFVLNSNKINSETLLVLFKSDPIQALLQQQCTGTILTAYNKDSLLSIPLPEINDRLQQIVKSSVEKSFQLRRKSLGLFDVATHAVEIAIEKDEVPAIEYIRHRLEE